MEKEMHQKERKLEYTTRASVSHITMFVGLLLIFDTNLPSLHAHEISYNLY